MDDAALNIAFDELLGILRKAGFQLSPNDYVEFAAIFRQFNGTREELKYLLAPVICRNSGDQQRFYQLYDKYTTPGPAKHVPPEDPVNNPYITEKTATHFLRISSRGYYAWLMGLLLFAIGFRMLLMHLYPKPVNAPAISVTAHSDSVAPEPAVSNARTFVLKTQKPIVRDPKDYSIAVPTGPEIEKVNSVHSSTFAWLFVLGSAAFILSLTFFPLRRSRSRPHVDIDRIDSDFGLLDIPLPTRDRLIRDLPVLAHIARDLAQPQPTEYSRLAIRQTISESIRADGLLTPVYEAIHRRPEYVFLIDSRNPLRAGLYRYLGRTLAKYSLPVHYYLGDASDSFRADGSTRRLSRYQLEQRHGDARWIDFETGDIPAAFGEAFDFGVPTDSPGVADIHEWLDDEDLFQWLCALAVVPTVRWEVTLAVGAAVLKQRGALHKLHFGSLLRFSQIGWLATSTGAIPPR